MLTIQFINISKLAAISDYKYLVRVNGELIDRGVIKGHKRDMGWKDLVKRLTEEEA